MNLGPRPQWSCSWLAALAEQSNPTFQVLDVVLLSGLLALHRFDQPGWEVDLLLQGGRSVVLAVLGLDLWPLHCDAEQLRSISCNDCSKLINSCSIQFVHATFGACGNATDMSH